jgi:hypothetical protein
MGRAWRVRAPDVQQPIEGSSEVGYESVYEATLCDAIRSDFRTVGYFAERGVLVVPAVTRREIEAAVAQQAERDFVDLHQQRHAAGGGSHEPVSSRATRTHSPRRVR